MSQVKSIGPANKTFDWHSEFLHSFQGSENSEGLR